MVVFLTRIAKFIKTLKNNKNIQISDNNQVKTSNNNFININFFFVDHKISRLDTDCNETITFKVVMKNKTIFKEDIAIDPMHFHNLVNLPPERSILNQRLLDIAAELIPISDKYKEQP